ncbi:methyltransferase type 11 [Lophiostoma macrostomum CBS 122681]|uniref:Methyltransferase type 11 n=1 Tax=Lophiostoma macrostomum CBS 122681 TaxID=1314788 RepID=A0A6A6T1H3_9PLEO|nr:methyltransferase type 11 [Lophiostoma macrostomum CBS 122681]
MAIKTRFLNVLRPLQLIWLSIQFHYAAFRAALRKYGLTALAHPRQIRDAASANLFIAISGGFIAYENTTVVQSLVSSSSGKILELGPGPGNQLQRFDQSLVTSIYGIEPNAHYASHLTSRVEKFGLQDKYKLLTCGIEDSDVLRSEGIEEGSIDTVLSIQVLCSVNDVRCVVREIHKLLKPGGRFVFWEHIRNRDGGTALTQACLNPAWSAFVGCHVNRDILKDILNAGEWENPNEIEISDEPESVLPRIWGVLRKKI